MSGSSPQDDRAGLYVLGALNAEEMRIVRLAAGRDDVLATEVGQRPDIPRSHFLMLLEKASSEVRARLSAECRHHPRR